MARAAGHRRASGAWLALGLAAFAIGGAVSLDRLNLSEMALAVMPLLAAALGGVPLNALLTAKEYQVSTQVVGIRIPFGWALRTSITATAMNLLPLPGGAAVRISDLTGSGSRPLAAAGVTATMGVLWIAVAGVAAGAALLVFGSVVAGSVVISTASVLLWIGWLAFRLTGGSALLFSKALSIELASIAIGSLRLWLVFLGLGKPLSLVEPTVIAVSGALASAFVLFPGGIGLREGLAAALAPLVNVDPGLAFVASGLNRLLGISVQLPMLAVLWYKSRVAKST